MVAAASRGTAFWVKYTQKVYTVTSTIIHTVNYEITVYISL